jgi:hypothetical protein
MALKNNEVPANGVGERGSLPLPPDGPIIIPGYLVELEVLSVYEEPAAKYMATLPLLDIPPKVKPAPHQWRRFPKRP